MITIFTCTTPVEKHSRLLDCLPGLFPENGLGLGSNGNLFWMEQK
jgi:hypothetical protein